MTNLFPVAKEGWNYIAYSLGVFVLTLLSDLEFLAIMFFAFSVFFIYVFRNPERELTIVQEKSVLSPVDGVIIDIEELDDSEYFYKLSLKSSYGDVSLFRAPMNAKVSSQGKYSGSRLTLQSPLGKKLNENTTLVFEDIHANKVKITHRVQESFCGIKTDSVQDKQIIQSSRYGVMVNGISEVYLPENFRLNVHLDDEVKASQTLLGYFS
ncbi:MAG: phosphatidylserine decarboxylase [Sulfurimonas sp.]|nr:phosphatidylserine decarboxylase [Sulfurimonas sp.]MDQ7062385.1 phosphatidylserine decarboxylase [Sulfurimonas sp.]